MLLFLLLYMSLFNAVEVSIILHLFVQLYAVKSYILVGI